MKKSLQKRIVTGFCIAAILAVRSFEAYAVDTGISESPGAVFGDRDDFKIQAVSDRNLFSNMKELVPGDQVSDTITIANKSSMAVTIYLKAYAGDGASEDEDSTAGRKDQENGSIAAKDGKTFNSNLLSLIGMRIRMDGKDLYGDDTFSMSAAGQGDLTDSVYGLELGTFPAGSTRQLEVTIRLPGEQMGNEYMNTFTEVVWKFYAEGEDKEPEKPAEPTEPADPTEPTSPVQPVSPSPDPRPSRPSGNISSADPGVSPAGPELVTIADTDVPLAAITGEDGDGMNIVIADQEVPLASLAKTGSRVIYLKQTAIILLLLILGLMSLNMVKRIKEQE